MAQVKAASESAFFSDGSFGSRLIFWCMVRNAAFKNSPGKSGMPLSGRLMKYWNPHQRGFFIRATASFWLKYVLHAFLIFVFSNRQ